MSLYRTNDLQYGEEYFETLDNGLGYKDSTMWEDIAHIFKELFGYSDVADISGSVNVLDMGCAKGYLVRHLRKRGFDAWGTDISTYALQHAPADVVAYLRADDLSDGNPTFFGHERFDTITCFETLEHIPEEHAADAVLKIRNTLRPNGMALLTICTSDQPGWESDPTHVNIKPRSYWEELIGSIGFEICDELIDRIKQYWLFKHHDGVFIIRRKAVL